MTKTTPDTRGPFSPGTSEARMSNPTGDVLKLPAKLDDNDMLHIEAAAHADEVARTSIAYRIKNNLKPPGRYATDDLWLARFESYKAGVIDERARRIGEVQARVAQAGGRREGRTLQLVRSLDPGVRAIVVHTAQMKDYIERMLRNERMDLIVTSELPRVVVVTSTQDCDRLRGVRFAVDHAMLENASAEVFSLLRALSRHRDSPWK